MLRNIVAAASLVALVAATTTTAEARPRPKKGSSFESNKTFGLGVMLGAPTAISGKLFLSEGGSTAIDFGLGAYYGYRDDGLHIHADFLWHPVNLVKTEHFWLPLYFGLGLRVFDHNRFNDHLHIGPRVPVGISFDFTNVPLDVFLELAFIFDLVNDNDRDDDFRSDAGFAIGIRYYF